MWTNIEYKAAESNLFAFANRKKAWRDRGTRYGAGGTASGATTHGTSSSATSVSTPRRRRSDALRIGFARTKQPGRGLPAQQRRQDRHTRTCRKARGQQPHTRRAKGLRSDSLDRIHLIMYLRAIMYSASESLPGLIMQTLTNNRISITLSHCL